MTAGEQLEQRGLQRGMQQGMQQGKLLVAEQMLRQGLDIKLVEQCTQLSNRQLHELMEKFRVG